MLEVLLISLICITSPRRYVSNYCFAMRQIDSLPTQAKQKVYNYLRFQVTDVSSLFFCIHIPGGMCRMVRITTYILPEICNAVKEN